jgi:endonuclease VIII
MPEADTIFRAARTLHKALAGETVKSFETVLPKLARVDYDLGLAERVIEKVEAQGKWTKMYFSGDLILLTHMLMSGSWHIYRPGEAWKRHRIHHRIVIATERYVAVAFNVPVAEFHSPATLTRRLRLLGPSVLAPELDKGKILANLCAQADSEVGAALLNQLVLAGIGNVFKSEVCFGCGVNPFRRVASLTIQEMACLVATARKFTMTNVTEDSGDQIVTHTGLRRTTGRASNEERLWVYKRRGKACHRCGSAIEARKQMPNARSTFWCPQCQPMVKVGRVVVATGSTG